MTQQSLRTEEERVLSLIKEYQSEGYNVLVQPRREELPEFLQRVQPDLVASRGDENIVVEVRSRSTLGERGIDAFVQAVEGHPGWAFELVLVNPPETGTFGASYRSLDTRQLHLILDQAEAFRGSDPRYTALLTWVAIEGAVAERLTELDANSPSRSPKRMIKEALSLGLIDPEDARLLERLAEFRNRFIHAINVESLSPHELDVAIQIARTLLDAEMTDR